MFVKCSYGKTAGHHLFDSDEASVQSVIRSAPVKGLSYNKNDAEL